MEWLKKSAAAQSAKRRFAHVKVARNGKGTPGCVQNASRRRKPQMQNDRFESIRVLRERYFGLLGQRATHLGRGFDREGL